MADEDSYTVKEIVDMTRQEQTAGFTRIESLLESKADKADLEPIHEKLTKHDGHIRELQDVVLVTAQQDAAREKRTNFWRWAIGTGAVLAATALGAFLAHLH